MSEDRGAADRPDRAAAVDHRRLFAGLPTAYLVLDPDLVIVEANQAYLELLGRTRAGLLGRPVLDAFPPAPGDQGGAMLRLSFERVRDTARPDVLPLFPYPVADARTGEPAQRYWSLVHAPLLDADGRTVLLVQRVEDVTDLVGGRQDRDADRARQRVREVEADLYGRMLQLRAAERARAVSRQRLAALTAAALALGEARDLGDLGEIVVRRGLLAAGCDGGAVALFDPADPGVLLSTVSDSYGTHAQRTYARLPVDGSLPVSVAARTGRRVLLGDRAASLAFSPDMAGVLESTGSQAFASLPLLVGGQVVGVLTAGWEQPQAFPADEVEILDAFAAQCAQAIDRLRTREAERAAVRAVTALAEVSVALAEAHDVPTLTDLLLDGGLAALGAQGGAVGLRDGDVLELAMTASLGEETRLRYSTLPIGSPLPTAVAAATGRAVVLADRAACLRHGDGMAEVVAATGCQAWVAVPMVFEEQVLGSLTLGWAADQSFTRTQFDILDGFAAQCAQAVARIRDREDERASAARAAAMAHALQRSLLTAPAVQGDLDVAVRYRPAAVDAQVGGDWYDAFDTPGGTANLVVGDVSGHDQRAAAAMAQVRNLLRGISHVIAEPPAAILARLDRTIRDLRIGSYATAVLATVERSDPAAGGHTMRWSSAGHLPPLLVRPDGTTELLETKPELLLGVNVDTPRTDHAVDLAAGSVVLLYTDGLVERRHHDLDEGLDWLRTAVAALAAAARDRPLDPEQLCDALLAAVGGSGDDDMVLLAVRTRSWS